MRRQFSIATLLWLVAACAVFFSLVRVLGYDGVVLASPLLGAGAGGWLARRRRASVQWRWVAATLAAGIVSFAVCQADPRQNVTRPSEIVALGIPICFLYGLMVTALLEVSLSALRAPGR
jgi:hypothetical protein